MRLIHHEDAIVKVLLTVGLTLSAAYLLHAIYLLVDNYGAARLLREEAMLYGELSRQTEGDGHLRGEVEKKIDAVAERVIVSEASRKDLLAGIIGEGEDVDASVRIGSVGQYPGDEGLRSASLTVAMDGSYPDVLAFISRIERMAYYVHIDSVDLESAGDGRVSGQLRGYVLMTGI